MPVHISIWEASRKYTDLSNKELLKGAEGQMKDNGALGNLLQESNARNY